MKSRRSETTQELLSTIHSNGWARSRRARYFRGFARDDTSIGVAILGVRIILWHGLEKKKITIESMNRLFINIGVVR